MAKKFIVLTSGRAGSTSLMEALAQYNDIALPRQLFACQDDELLHPRRVKAYAHRLAGITGRQIKNSNALIQGFFQHKQKAAYVGFKSMPERHPQLNQLVADTDITIITLIREDIASTVASFQMAFKHATWRRHGQAHQYRLSYDPAYDHLLEPNIRYVLQSRKVLKQIPGAVALTYEQLCQPDFSHAKLDQFFQRSVGLIAPVKPVHGSSYVHNWSAFAQMVQQIAEQF